MERRLKLLIAAIALGFLVAGMARRWSKEGASFPPAPASSFTPRELAARTADRTSAPSDATSSAWSEDRSLPHAPVAGQEFAQPSAFGGPTPQAEVARTAYIPEAPWPPRSASYNDGQPYAEASHGTNYADAMHDRRDAGFQPPPYSPIPATVPPGRYVIQPNDSYWTISQRIYGTARYFQALYEHNRRICPQPDRLPAGVTIETPQPYQLERSYPDLFR